MAKISVQEKINKTAEEMRKLVHNSQRKLLELEALLSLKEFQSGNYDVFDTAKDFVRKMQ